MSERLRQFLLWLLCKMDGCHYPCPYCDPEDD